jgi:RimJ/RimL family protein N-acetyltransferase
MDVLLETNRLLLRRFTMADVDNLVSLDADPEVTHFITGGLPTSREEAEHDMLPGFLDYYERFDGLGFWAVVEKTSGDFLGWFHFRPRDDDTPGEVELGYRLRKSAWGKGYATEGSRALIRKGFADLGVERVFAETMAVHTASRRVMEKSGLRFARAFFEPWPYSIEGDEQGDVEYALTRAEWQRQE